MMVLKMKDLGKYLKEKAYNSFEEEDLGGMDPEEAHDNLGKEEPREALHNQIEG